MSRVVPGFEFGVWLTLAACGGGGGFPDAPSPDQPGPTGTFSVTWSVVDQNNQPIACERISAQTMTVLTHNIAVEGGSTEPLGCSTGMGMSQGLAPGEYEMDFELAGPDGVLATGTRQTGVQIVANTNVELAPVTFQVEAVGSVSLKLATGKVGGNCGAIGSGGAGIQQMTITLQHNSDLSCEPVTFSISDGATQTGGMYMVNCATPFTRACIESDQVIAAQNIPSDSYTIRVRGIIGTNACWTNQDALQVPAKQKTLLRTLNLAQQTQIPGC
jgi:hypothetical protein